MTGLDRHPTGLRFALAAAAVALLLAADARACSTASGGGRGCCASADACGCCGPVAEPAPPDALRPASTARIVPGLADDCGCRPSPVPAPQPGASDGPGESARAATASAVAPCPPASGHDRTSMRHPTLPPELPLRIRIARLQI